MRTRRLLALTSLGVAALIAGPAFSCTTVCLQEGSRPIVAYNYDFDPPEGLILVNKRGVAKRRLDETRYPASDARPAISVAEWIQYNLDRHATVAEVLANAEAVRPTSRVPVHYLFADATGDAAAVEFLDGKLVAHRGSTLPVRALANSTYEDSVAALGAATRRGELPASRSSLDRFARAALLAREPSADPIARCFEILASVAQPDLTRWSIVYDLGAREVHFRTDGNRAIRRIALSSLDFSCGSAVKMLDVRVGSSGDVTRDLTDYTRTANRALIESSFEQTPLLRGIPAASRDAFAAHPETTSSCAAPK